MSRCHSPADSCWPTRPQASQPTSHPPVQTSLLPNGQWLSPKADIDTAIVTPFSSNAGLISAASSGFQASFPKREEKRKFDRYPFPPPHQPRPISPCAPKKVIKALYSDTDHPTTATRDAWAAVQTTIQQHEPSPCDPDATCFTTVPTPVHPRCQFLLAAMPPVRVRLDPRCLSPPVDSQDRVAFLCSFLGLCHVRPLAGT